MYILYNIVYELWWNISESNDFHHRVRDFIIVNVLYLNSYSQVTWLRFMVWGLDRIIWYRFATLIYVKLYAAYRMQHMILESYSLGN